MAKKIESRAIQAFQAHVYDYYETAGRHTLPWRHTNDPYHILVSEIMLQQTQVDRVIPKYEAFLKKFPTPEVLAQAPLSLVLTLWVGLGYNRRARYLHEAAKAVVKRRAFPRTLDDLQKLPGVGSYTAAAVAAFAYNEPVVLIETNLRTVFLHHFYKSSKGTVTDRELLTVIDSTLDHAKPRVWYYALMDYGSYLKREIGNHRDKSASYKKQSAFKGSKRQIRGYIIRSVSSAQKSVAVAALLKQATFPLEREILLEQLEALTKEGMIVKTKGGYTLAT